MKPKYERTSYTLSLLFRYYYPKGGFMLYRTNDRIGFNYSYAIDEFIVIKYIKI